MKIKKSTLFMVLFVISLLFNLWLAYSDYMHDKLIHVPQKKFALLSPDISDLSTEQFLEKRKGFIVSYRDLKTDIALYLNKSNSHGTGVYFEDLTTGAWFGVNERNEYIPASLLKVPTVVAILKRVEEGTLNFEQQVTIREKDVDPNFGTLFQRGYGYNITIAELINYTIIESDNTALHALNNLLDANQLLEARTALGLPFFVPSQGSATKLSPKEYSNILRALYYSSYLRRPFSEYLLTTMTHTHFDQMIPAKLPSNLTIAHKIGEDLKGGYYHDCGVIYAKDHPYVLCIMTQNSTLENAHRVASEISKKVYDYVESD